MIIKYKQEYKNNFYFIFLDMPRDFFLSQYIGRYIFLSSLKNKYPLKQYCLVNGKPSKKDLENLEKVKIIKIESSEKENIFNVPSN